MNKFLNLYPEIEQLENSRGPKTPQKYRNPRLKLKCVVCAITYERRARESSLQNSVKQVLRVRIRSNFVVCVMANERPTRDSPLPYVVQ